MLLGIVSIWLCISSVSLVDSLAQESDESTPPWDYQNARNADDLATDEKNHFNPNVQIVIEGQSGDHLGSDLEYMLRYFPGHQGTLKLRAMALAS